jgi:hypothetical protein
MSIIFHPSSTLPFPITLEISCRRKNVEKNSTVNKTRAKGGINTTVLHFKVFIRVKSMQKLFRTKKKGNCFLILNLA